MTTQTFSLHRPRPAARCRRAPAQHQASLPRIVASALVVVALATYLLAFGASHAFTDRAALDAYSGSQSIAAAVGSGYRIDLVSYVAAAHNPAEVAAVTFHLDPPDAAAVKARFAANGAWAACTVAPGGAGHVTCDTGTLGLTFGAVTGLEVVAAR